MNRRQLLKTLAACAAGGAAGLAGLSQSGIPGRLARVLAQGTPPSGDKKPKFLIVLTAFGGASIVDSFLAIRESETANPQTINAFPDELVKDIADSPLRGVDLQRSTIGGIPFPFQTRQSEFVQKHKQDMMVVTLTGTSVNHQVAQKRALTGNGAWSGRTLQEAVALEYGGGYLVPNVNMSVMGYLERGDDPSLPSYCYAEPVGQPTLWPLSLDGSRGIQGAPDKELVNLARQMRDQTLDSGSPFVRTFQGSQKLQQWQSQRAMGQELEARDLITKLNIFANTPEFPLADYGLGTSADAERLRAAFPNYAMDPLDAKAVLAFLLIKYGVSMTVTLSPTTTVIPPMADGTPANTPVAFDFSHSAHRSTQAAMWQRVLRVADRLIDLLKSEEFDPATGESYWDRTLIYIATDFGRSRNRVGGADEFSSGHHLNNGVLLISPMVNGNTILGGVDRDTGLTYGFDPRTGVADVNRHTTEPELYAGILQALSVSTTGSGLPDMPAMRRNG